MKFIDFMTGPKAAVELAKGGELPPRKSSYKDPYFSTTPAAELMNYKEILEQRGGWVRYPEQFAEASNLMVEGAQKMVLQNRSPKEVLDEAAQKYNALLKR